MALGAQGQDKGSIFCDKCFNASPKGSEFCQNCGAALVHKPGAEGSDVAVYPKLAQVNLLRMRGRFKEAEETCLGILHQYPHNLSANVLMGDLAVEQSHLDQAVEWYELALDIDPENTGLQSKLEAAKSKKDDTVVQTIVQELGLPDEKPKTLMITLISVGAIIVLALLAWFAYKSAKAAGEVSQVNKPIYLQDTTAGTGGATGAPGDTTGGTAGSTGSQPVSEEDTQLTKLLASKTSESEFVVDARFDLNGGMSITYNAPSDKDEREIGAKLATESFGIVKDSMDRDIDQVSLRAVRDRKLFYSAIVKRDDYEATQSTDWQNAHKGDLDAFLKVVLTNEKHASDDTSTTTTGGETGGDQTTGGTAGTDTSSGDTAGTPPSGSTADTGTTGSAASSGGTAGTPPPATDTKTTAGGG
jgi:hypothetical protein